MFYGRKEELGLLNSRFQSKRKEFGVIYGRRRIGKTELIREFFKDKEGILFQAKKDNSYGNLKSFSYEIDKLLSLPTSFIFSNWEECFDALKEHFAGKRYVVIIDEYPFIVAQDSSFSSIIQAFYDHADDNLFLVLLGSDVSFLKKEITDHASPLYKRRTFEIELRKLHFNEAVCFLEGMSNDEKCNYLSLMSSYPFYLSAIDKNQSFEENMINLLFSQYGTFFNLPDQLLSNSTNVQDVYNAILLSIAHRHYRLNEISEDIREDAAKVSKYMTTLVNSEIIEKRETFMGNKRSHYYVIADPLLRFWYSFIFVNQERIKVNGKMIFQEEVENIRLFISRAFEDIVNLYIDDLNREGKLGQIYPPIKNFKADKTSLNRSVEIDGLSQTGNTLLVVESKYRNKPFTNEMMKHLQESASIFPGKWNREYYIFSKSGFDENLKTADNIHCYTPEDMFNTK